LGLQQLLEVPLDFGEVLVHGLPTVIRSLGRQSIFEAAV